MSTALETFRRQQQVVEALNQQANELARTIGSVRTELEAIARHETLRDVLVQKQRWLQRTEDAVMAVRAIYTHVVDESHRLAIKAVERQLFPLDPTCPKSEEGDDSRSRITAANTAG